MSHIQKRGSSNFSIEEDRKVSLTEKIFGIVEDEQIIKLLKKYDVYKVLEKTLRETVLKKYGSGELEVLGVELNGCLLREAVANFNEEIILYMLEKGFELDEKEIFYIMEENEDAVDDVEDGNGLRKYDFKTCLNIIQALLKK